MVDYIDREAVIAEIPREMDMQDLYLPVHFIELLNDIPTADVVEVVQCKDCAVPHNPLDRLPTDERHDNEAG